jgi:hypothetical protein
MPPAAGERVFEPADVLLLSAEDGAEVTIRPRLEAAGANLARVHILEAVAKGDSERPPILPSDLDLMAEVVCSRGVRLIVIDPFMAYLDGEIDAHKDQDVRRCLHRLKLMAEEADAAVLVIRHLNKMNGASAIYRGGGSIGITGAARSALLVGKHPTDAQTFVLAGVKVNLAKHPRSLTYYLDQQGDVARIGWGQEVDLAADDIIAHPSGRIRQKTAVQAAEFVREFLAGGERESADLDSAMREAGFSARSIKEGRKLTKVTVRRTGYGPGQKWLVGLSAEGQQQEDESVF